MTEAYAADTREGCDYVVGNRSAGIIASRIVNTYIHSSQSMPSNRNGKTQIDPGGNIDNIKPKRQGDPGDNSGNTKNIINTTSIGNIDYINPNPTLCGARNRPAFGASSSGLKIGKNNSNIGCYIKML